jgi:hypothetical protein
MSQVVQDRFGWFLGGKSIFSTIQLDSEIKRLGLVDDPTWNMWRGKANSWNHTNGDKPSEGWFLMIRKEVRELITTQAQVHDDDDSGGVEFTGHRLKIVEYAPDGSSNLVLYIPTQPTRNDEHPLLEVTADIVYTERLTLYIDGYQRIGGGFVDDDQSLCLVHVVDFRHIMAMQMGLKIDDGETVDISSSFGRPGLSDPGKFSFFKQGSDFVPFLASVQTNDKKVLPLEFPAQKYPEIEPHSTIQGFTNLGESKIAQRGEYWPQIKAANPLEWTEKRLNATGRTIVFDYTADSPIRLDPIGASEDGAGDTMDTFRDNGDFSYPKDRVIHDGDAVIDLDPLTSGIMVPREWVLLYPVFDIRRGGGPPESLYAKIKPSTNPGSITGTRVLVYVGVILWKDGSGYKNLVDISASANEIGGIVSAVFDNTKYANWQEEITMSGIVKVRPSGAFDLIRYSETPEMGFTTFLRSAKVDWWRKVMLPDFYPAERIFLVKMKEDLKGGIGCEEDSRTAKGYFVGFGYNDLVETSAPDDVRDKFDRDDGYEVTVDGQYFHGCAFGVHEGTQAEKEFIGDIVVCIANPRAGGLGNSGGSYTDENPNYLMAVGAGRQYERGECLAVYGGTADIEITLSCNGEEKKKTITALCPYGEPTVGNTNIGIVYRQSTGEWEVVFEECPEDS